MGSSDDSRLQNEFQFSKMRRVSPVIVPCSRSPVSGLIATIPEEKISPPAQSGALVVTVFPAKIKAEYGAE